MAFNSSLASVAFRAPRTKLTIFTSLSSLTLRYNVIIIDNYTFLKLINDYYQAFREGRRPLQVLVILACHQVLKMS